MAQIRTIEELKSFFGVNRPNVEEYYVKKKEEFLNKINIEIYEQNADGKNHCQVFFDICGEVTNPNFIDELRDCEKKVLEEIKAMFEKEGYNFTILTARGGRWAPSVSWSF